MTKKKKTSQFLRNCIFEALMLLLDTKKYEDITVSELAEKAGVSRMTYYRTYSSKEDIVVQYMKEKTNQLISMFEEKKMDRYDWYLYFFKDVAENRDIADKIFTNPSLCTAALKHCVEFSKYVLHALYGIDTENPEISYKILFETGGFIFVLAKWVHAGCRQTPEEMVKWIEQYQKEPSFLK